MKRFLRWLAIIVAIVLVGGYLVLEFVIKTKPMGMAKDYWAQRAKGELTHDVIGQWNYVQSVAVSLSYLEKPFFEEGEPYRLEKYTEWCREHMFNTAVLGRQGSAFAMDDDYGWPMEMRGMGWSYALAPIAYAAASIAVIEPARTKEVVYYLGELAEAHRRPPFWLDYAIQQQWGSPLRDNIMWKGPHLMVLGLYTLISGDKERFGPEMQALSRDVYRQHLVNMAKPEGRGRTAGVCCEPNHWFPQCNSWAVNGLALYDKIFGPDKEFGVLIGEAYRKDYLAMVKSKLQNPKTGMLRRSFHPREGFVEKFDGAFPSAFVALMLKQYDPEWAGELYRTIRENYVKDIPLDLGASVLESLPTTAKGELLKRDVSVGMIGEGALAILVMLAATREFDDQETFDRINKTMTNLMHPQWTEYEIRFDHWWNDDETGIPNFTMGKLFNMYSGWWLWAKVHVGWGTLMNHDWAAQRDAQGNLKDYSAAPRKSARARKG
jgi:hypothetical protein